MPNNVAKGFIPEIWDASVMRTLEDNLILKKIVRGVDITAPKGKGDTVYFTGLADPTVSDYAGTLSHEALKDSQIAMLVDKEKAYAFSVADEDSLMANVDLKGSQAQRAAYQLKDVVEKAALQDIAGYATAGTVTDATCDTGSILSDLGLLAQRLAENNVSEDNMWMVIPPWVRLKLQLAGVKFSINEGLNGTGSMAWTNELGFDTYVTNTVYNSGTVAAPVSSVLAGSYQSIGYADIQVPVRKLPASTKWAVNVDGGLIYGYKVIKPKELALAELTYAAETTI